MSASNEVILFSSTIAVATILNVGAIFVLYKRRPMCVIDILLLHNFGTSMTYGVLRFVSIITSPPSSQQRLGVNKPFLEALTWLFGSIQMLMLGLIAYQRFVAVYFPFKVKVWCTKSRTCKLILASYVIVLFTACLLVVTNLKIAFVTVDTTIYTIAVLKVSLSTILFGVYFLIFLKLFMLKSPASSSREGPRKKIKSYLFSLAITCSNLIAFLPVVLHVFARGVIAVPMSVMVLAWIDLIFNPISYIALKMGKRISELPRSICCLRWKKIEETDVAVHFRTIMLLDRKRNSKPDSPVGIGNNSSDNEVVS